jgi:hypothetical protein
MRRDASCAGLAPGAHPANGGEDRVFFPVEVLEQVLGELAEGRGE